jgi:hypothetical protein
MLLTGFFSYIMNKNILLRQQIFFSIFDQLILSVFALVCELRLKLQKFTQADPGILRKIPSINL